MHVSQWFRRRARVDSVDRAVEAYEASVESSGTPLRRFWADLGSKRTPSVLAALVKVDLHRRFEAGERPKVLEYLHAFPVLAEVNDCVVSLVYEEFCLLEEVGERPDSLAFCEEYGPWRDSLRSQLAYHRELSRAIGVETPAVNFPDLGDRFDKYRLNSLLGVGGVARVYLATEEELGDRQVAIKVSASFGQEPSILAKLDHRNIVPILTVAESESGLRGICMPYRPGATLEELIRRIGRGTPPRSARAISDALRPRDSPAGFPPEEQRVGWADFPIDSKFPEAVAWIGLALANALSYLHQQGISHRDIKPANILLAFREGPQLLDFNLAQVPSSPEGATAAQKGGTLPYMAPEQLKAFLDPTAWDDVEATADLYSLGLVLRELLTGRPPELPTSQGSLAREIQSLIDRRLAPSESICEINRDVPPALESIIDKCLAFRPEDRYASANDLAEDLRQFLDRKPLLVAPNTSKIELAANWTYRNRNLVFSTFSFVLLFVVLASFLPLYARDKPAEDRLPVPDRLSVPDPLLVAEQLLDSGRREDLPLAKAKFEPLVNERPETARPAVGLALTLRKLGDPRDNNRINDLLGSVTKKGDAETVIRHRLDKDPESYLLNLTLGIILAEHKSPDARQSFEKALKIDPEGFSAHVMLARLDDLAGQPREALGRLRRVVKLAIDKQVDVKRIYGLRKAMLHMLVQVLDRGLENVEGGGDRAKVASDCEELESQLQSFEDDWRKFAREGDQTAHDYFIQFFEGCLSSIQGVINSNEDDPDQSTLLFDKAGRQFEQAKFLETLLKREGDRIPLLSTQQEKLFDRREGISRRAIQP